jgi:aspartyl-tRNA(Asn)/glutamyl-tRNA(Gln) amidotransferase subunit C
MNITEETVANIARLARLRLSDEEVTSFAPQLNDILTYAEQLQAVNLEGTEPTSHPFTTHNVFREDVPRPSLAREVALACAPDSDGEQVRVPAVLEG